MENAKITNLYNLDETIAKEYLSQFTYPWEALAGISDFIKELGPTLDPEIYEKRGEDIWVAKSEMDSIENYGTTFSFEIITHTKPGEKINTDSLKEIKRCLIIDDNKDNRTILEQILQSWGIHTHSCADGYTALEIIRTEEPFDVIICDYHMPEMDGLETIKRIRENRANEISTTRQPVILLLSSSHNDRHTDNPH
jgi:CheY-like chemotaxis protein